MATRRVKPIYDKDKYSDPITEELSFHLWDLIYRPLIELLEDETGLEAKWNSYRYLTQKIKTRIEEMTVQGRSIYDIADAISVEFKMDGPSAERIVSDYFDPSKKKRWNDSLTNTKKGLIEALHGGKIQYRDGYFIGEFNSSISKTIVKFGGTWDKNRKSFKISLDALPIEIKTAISASKQKTERIVSKLTAELDRIEEANESLESYKIPFGPDVDKVLNDLDVQFEKVTPDDLVITPKLDDATRDRLRGEYHENLNYYVKGWREEAIYRLRKQIDKNAFDGFRSKRMMETIQAEYGVSKNKAKFLARQETSLLVSAYRKSRYEKIGSWGYIWSTSHDVRVRHDHKRLDGKTFSWDDPPIVDQDTGRRAHPGQDFQCRCVALPLFDEQNGKLKERVKT